MQYEITHFNTTMILVYDVLEKVSQTGRTVRNNVIVIVICIITLIFQSSLGDLQLYNFSFHLNFGMKENKIGRRVRIRVRIRVEHDLFKKGKSFVISSVL